MFRARSLVSLMTGLLVCLSIAGGLPTITAAADEKKPSEEGFVSLFDGKDIDQWQIVGKVGPGYVVKDGILVCPKDGGGKLMTKKEYDNFVFRFEYRLEPGGNNGVGIRAPLEGDAAYAGMEIQILDDDAPQYATLQPFQYHGSIYGCVAAKRGAPKKPGEWNTEEIVCDGRHLKVTVNDKVVVDANLDDVKDEATLKAHPGLQRKTGHIGFLGHGAHVDFRSIRVKPLPGGSAK